MPMIRTPGTAGCRLAFMLLLVAVAATAHAEGIIVVGTDDHTGVYYKGGGGLCSLINEGRSEHRMRCRVKSTAGAVDNIDAVRRGERALGFAPAGLALDAYEGSGVFSDRGRFEGLRVVTALNNETVALVVRDDAGIGGIRDLAGQRVNLGSEGSGERAMMEGLMEVLGWVPSEFADARSLSVGEQVDAFCDGELDAIVFVSGHPSRGVRDALDCGGELVPVDGAAVSRMVGNHDQYHSAAIPARTYPAVNRDVATYGVAGLLLSSTNTTRDSVYEVTRALFEHLERFREWHDSFAGMSSTAMVERTRESGIPLHPGAELYLRDNDLW